MNEASLSPGETSLTLGAVLSRVATELSNASDDMKVMQDTMDDLADGSLSSKAMVCLQSLDLVEQTVRALAEIVGSIAALGLYDLDGPPGDLLAKCKLSALVDRLAGVSRDEDMDFDLF